MEHSVEQKKFFEVTRDDDDLSKAKVHSMCFMIRGYGFDYFQNYFKSFLEAVASGTRAFLVKLLNSHFKKVGKKFLQKCL